MKDIYKIIRILQMSPMTFLSKIAEILLKKVTGQFQKRNLKYFPTYHLDSKDEIKLKHVYKFPDFSELKLHSEQIIHIYRNISQHNFDLLGSGKVHIAHKNKLSAEDFINSHLNTPNKPNALKAAKLLATDYEMIDFQTDFRVGYRWNEATLSSRLTYGNSGADVKNVWELARMQDLLILAYAYKLASEGIFDEEPNKILAEFQNRIIDFYISNPPSFGIQWKCSMDISIRLVNILVATSFFLQAGGKFEHDFMVLLNNLAFDHINYVLNNPEFSGGMRGNHYFTNICGLLISCLMMQDNADLRATLFMATNEFTSEVMHQFTPDGGNFEASLPYHYLCLEMLAEVIAALESQSSTAIYNIFSSCPSKYLKITHNTARFSDAFIKRLNDIFIFSLKFLEKGKTFDIGDNDSGKFIKFQSVTHYTLNDNFDRADSLSNIREILNYFSGNKSDYSSIFIRNTSLFSYQPDKSRYCFENFGLYKYENKLYSAVVRAGNIGQNGKGGHSHNDQLSLLMKICGQDFLVDNGTFAYTGNPTERNRFRSTAMHNTLSYDNREQNSWANNTFDDLFWLKKDSTRAKFILKDSSEVIAIHKAYVANTTRRIKFSENEIIGTDSLDLPGEKRIYFHFSPEVIIENITKNTCFLRCGEHQITFTCDNQFEIHNSEYSPAYGRKLPTKAIVITSNSKEIEWIFKVS